MYACVFCCYCVCARLEDAIASAVDAPKRRKNSAYAIRSSYTKLLDGGNLRKCVQLRLQTTSTGVRVFLRNCNMQQPRDKWHSSSSSLSGRLNMRKYISGHRRRRRHFLASQCRVSCCGTAKHTHKCAKQENAAAAAPKPNRIKHKFAKHVPARREPCCGGLTLWESSMAYEIYIYYSLRKLVNWSAARCVARHTQTAKYSSTKHKPILAQIVNMRM